MRKSTPIQIRGKMAINPADTLSNNRNFAHAKSWMLHQAKLRFLHVFFLADLPALSVGNRSFSRIFTWALFSADTTYPRDDPENAPPCAPLTKPAKIEGFAQPMTLEFKPNVRRKAHRPARPPAA
jgi:hypothetical protein